MRRSLVVASLIVASLAGSAFADSAPAPPKLRMLVLPLPPSHAIDGNVARTFDARLLVALDDTRRVQTITHDEEPECTTTKCLAALGVENGAAYVLSMSVVREDGGLTLFGTLVDTKSATAWRRIELPRIDPATLSRMAPAELVPQILGTQPGGIVLGFAKPRDAAGAAATFAITEHLTALRAFKVVPPDGTDRTSLTHRAEVVLTEVSVAEPRRHLCKWLDGTLVGTFSITDLSNGRVVFTKTVATEASERAHFSSRAEITDTMLGEAVAEWVTAFRDAGVFRPRR